MNEYEPIWNGRDTLTESLDRDYADMRGEGWDVIYEPPSPLTTPWLDFAHMHLPDPEQHVVSAITRPIRRLRKTR